MRNTLLLSLLLVACGPPPLNGNWKYTIGSGGCAGTMSLTETNGRIAGHHACGPNISGTVDGSESGLSVALSLNADGFKPVLITASQTASGNQLTGSANGSGFSGDAFTAVKQ